MREDTELEKMRSLIRGARDESRAVGRSHRCNRSVPPGGSMDDLERASRAESDQPLFRPGAEVERSLLAQFWKWCEAETSRRYPDYDAFDRFSVEKFRDFWRLFLRWSELPWEADAEPVCVGDFCETATFFPDVRLNYAECLLDGTPDLPAVTTCHADGGRHRLTRGELKAKVAALAAALDRLGVRPGDRTVAIGRNNAEVAIAALATAALGATFSSCAPDMGVPAILARFAPLKPTVLFGTFRRELWDTGTPAASRVAETAAGLSALTLVVALDDGPIPDNLSAGRAAVSLLRLDDLARTSGTQTEEWPRRPFNLPLFIMFSSGTTGPPKCILHGAGGTLLEHVKEHRLHCDLRAGDKLFFQTSCGWMMWNWQLSALASGVEIVLYDGPLGAPETFWRVVAQEGVTVFGTNPAYLQFCQAAGFSPGRGFDLSALRAVLSTGSILFPGQYDWVRDHVKRGLPLQSISGGTDIIGCFVLGNPTLPIYRGDIQCRSLGLDVRALLRPGDSSRIGELICASPFPSRPLGFYGDPRGVRFHEAYFAQNPGVWTHGDLIEATPNGGWRLHGRSDGILNVRGIRIGTAEIYGILDGIDTVVEAIAVEQQVPDEEGGTRLVLLVVLRQDAQLDSALVKRIRSDLARLGSPALVPARIADVEALPVTFSGKRSEAAARDAVNGRPVRNLVALRNPECLGAIASHPALRAASPVELAATGAAGRGSTSGLSGERLSAEIKEVCERTLCVSPIGPDDNLLELGADSLAILTMLLAIEARVGTRLPLAALLLAPTVEGLASFLSSTTPEERKRLSEREAGPSIRQATPADQAQVCALLEHGFVESGIKEHVWARIFNHPWSDRTDDRGFVIACGDDIVGFLGTIRARRRIRGVDGLVCNYSSWYVRPEYRGWGVALLAAAIHDDGVTYTSLTPGPTSRAAFGALKFENIETWRIVMPPLVNAPTLRRPAPSIHFDPVIVRSILTDDEHRVFDDHAPFECLQLVVQEGADYAYLVVKRRAQRPPPGLLRRLYPGRFPYSDVLHCSAPALLERHLERVKLAVLAHQRTAALVADSRLFLHRPAGLVIRAYGCCRSPVFQPADLDKLYSEIVLLPI
ncbi:MAG: acetoacetyl-CoA synthetase [Rhodospirillales bacterium]|nr:acetoacetyl-CoA synthetase [Rhodospirillales bacterium]